MAFGVYLRLLGEAKSIEEYNKSAPVPQFHLREMNSEGWIVEIQGPMDSAFEGRTVKFELTFTEEYPFVPPMIRCLDDMEGTGFIRNELLPFEGFSHDEWSHTIKVVQILLTIQGIMGTTKKKATKDAENHRAASPQHEESLRPMPIYQENTQLENDNQEFDDYENLEIVNIKSEQEQSPEKTKEEPSKRRVRKRSAKKCPRSKKKTAPGWNLITVADTESWVESAKTAYSEAVKELNDALASKKKHDELTEIEANLRELEKRRNELKNSLRKL